MTMTNVNMVTYVSNTRTVVGMTRKPTTAGIRSTILIVVRVRGERCSEGGVKTVDISWLPCVTAMTFDLTDVMIIDHIPISNPCQLPTACTVPSAPS